MSKKKIFIVDDDPMFSIMLSDYLEEKALYDITIFGTGEECIKQIYDNPDFVILDYNLNSFESTAMNGMQILERIKKINSNLQVIILSSQEKYGIASECIMKGANYYIIKDTSSFEEIGRLLED
ncbi:MAG: response regulator [Bacteroidota bacterium]|nr:response regulator [Bacteroidota bacterium]